MHWERETSPRPKLEKTADRREYASDRKIIFETASKRTDKIFSAAIKEKNFVDIPYSKEEIASDLKYVKDAETSFKEGIDEESQKGVELARIFEAIICDQGELANWFGENGMTIKSARYDDIKNGVDLIIEFVDGKEENSHLALAVDVTFSSFENLYQKLDKIKNDVENGRLTNIKYFQSEKSDFKGKKEGIPKTVIGADPKTIYRLMDLWVGEQEDALASHPIQFMILDQIMAQLTKFREYAESLKKPVIVKKYDQAIETVGRILDEKQDLREVVLSDDDLSVKNDRVHQAIIGYMDKMSTQKGSRVYRY